MVKILINHNHDQVIGRFEFHNGGIYLIFDKDKKITVDQIYNAWPGCGLKMVETSTDGIVTYVTVAQLVEFSILTQEVDDAERHSD